MTKFLKILLLACVAALSLSSCEKEELRDGDWEAMKWINPSELVQQDKVFIVPADGGSYTFECKNYHPWISDVIEGKDYTGQLFSPDNEDFHHLKGAWWEVKIDKKLVTITFSPLDSETDARDLTVDLTAGDIFDHLRFSQKRES